MVRVRARAKATARSQSVTGFTSVVVVLVIRCNYSTTVVRVRIYWVLGQDYTYKNNFTNVLFSNRFKTEARNRNKEKSRFLSWLNRTHLRVGVSARVSLIKGLGLGLGFVLGLRLCLGIALGFRLELG